jgi:hypothetical protein
MSRKKASIALYVKREYATVKWALLLVEGPGDTVGQHLRLFVHNAREEVLYPGDLFAQLVVYFMTAPFTVSLQNPDPSDPTDLGTSYSHDVVWDEATKTVIVE